MDFVCGGKAALKLQVRIHHLMNQGELCRLVFRS